MIQRELPNFNLKQIADSGQCFRMVPVSAPQSGALVYSVISGPRFLLAAQDPQDGPNGRTSFSCTEEDFPFWENYFDLRTDYGAFIGSIAPEDTYLREAAACGSGIRILKQDPWEMIITFIISQQKTIPNIRALVEALSRQYGTRLEAPLKGTGFDAAFSVPDHVYTFPTPEQLSRASLDDLLDLKLGYRAKYIKRVCENACSGALDLNYLSTLDYPGAMDYLVQFYGIGEKVANCICLFGLHHIDAFPVDTWIKKILLKEYAPRSKAIEHVPQSRLYETLIREFFSRYQGFAGIMQQYIFYFERTLAERRPVV